MGLIADDAEKCPSCGYNLSASKEISFYLEPGTVLNNRYYVGKDIGAGGFGITYKGYDQLLGRPVAVKEFFPQGLVTRSIDRATVQTYSGNYGNQFHTGLERFISEARQLAKFSQGLGIVQIHDCIYANGTGYIIMEYLEGCTLKEIVRKGHVFSFKEASQIILPVLEALKKVHAHGIIHRDVAPDNIFLTSSGKVLLIDFGASRLYEEDSEQTVSVILKHGYAPEEQYRAHTKLGACTDLYALSAVMYYMLTGQCPINSIDRIVKDELVPPSTLNASVTGDEEQVILKGMAVKAEDRYHSADEMYTAVSECLNSSVTAAPISVQELMDISKSSPEPEPQHVSGPVRKGPGRSIKHRIKSALRRHAKALIFIAVLTAALIAVIAKLQPDLKDIKIDDKKNHSDTTLLTYAVSHVHADGSVTVEQGDLTAGTVKDFDPSPREDELYAGTSILAGHTSLTADEATGRVTVKASEEYPSVRFSYYYQDKNYKEDQEDETLWLGMLLDASGSMGFAFDTPEPIKVTGYPHGTALTEDQINEILDNSGTDRTNLSYNSYRYYVRINEMRDEYSPLAYWNGEKAPEVLVDGQEVIPVASKDGLIIGILETEDASGPGWYYTQSTTVSAYKMLSTTKKLTGGSPVEIFVDDEDHLCCHYYNKTGAPVHTSYIYERIDNNPVRTEVLQRFVSSVVLETQKQFSLPAFSIIRFNNASFKDTELLARSWTSDSAEVIDAMNLSYSHGKSAGEAQEDGTRFYNFALASGTSTMTGLRSFLMQQGPQVNVNDRHSVLIISDGADTDSLGKKEDDNGFTAFDYIEELKKEGYTIATVFIHGSGGRDEDAENFLKSAASVNSNGEPLYRKLEDADYAEVKALAAELAEALK